MTFYSPLRPNRKRIQELVLEREQLCIDLEDAATKEEADDLRAAIHECEHQLFLNGFTSEYDL